MVAGVAGITADANSLVNYARQAAQQHLFNYNEDIPVELLAQRLCDLKQGYTQYGGLRPFGVSLLYAGYDPHYEFQLYHSDPSGNYSGWKATCIGANNGTAQSLLKQEYKDDITMEGAIDLVLRVMSKTMDSTTLGSEKRESWRLRCDVASVWLTRLDDSGIRDADARHGDQAAQGENLPTSRDRCVTAEARPWKEGRGHRDEVVV